MFTSLVGDLTTAADWGENVADVRQKYEDFKAKYSLKFKDAKEDEHRYSTFRKNLALIEETNRKNLSYTLEVNEYTAMTDEEFAAERSSSLGMYYEENAIWKTWSSMSQASHDTTDNVQAPTDFSWTEKGAVNPPIDQGSSGSCYAIATIGSVEGAFKVKTGVLPRMAPQEIIDCAIRKWV
ncbi:hypothetical protein FOL47_002252 [Perkinsus chesapeaki]|uniref:Cathepsin propeptide inhibitor domain-containing protein n=1 Tax=Perkinsus chesapeaki TaxID=330153 RepID=A0A7J6N134_PERCH|nr:hypothetical protein FOL47_002252 [Perkinsus chesapeaki]